MPSNIIPDQSANVNLMVNPNILNGKIADGTPYLKELFEAIINNVNTLNSESSTTPGSSKVGVKTTAYVNIDPGTSRNVSAVLDAIDAQFTNVSTGQIGNIGIAVLETNVFNAKEAGAPVPISMKDYLVEPFIFSAADRIRLDSTMIIDTAVKALQHDTGDTEGYIYDVFYFSENKTLVDVVVSQLQDTNSIFDVSAGVSETQTQLTSSTDRSSELKNQDYVWFIKMRRIDLGGSNYTEWKQEDFGTRIQLVSDASFGAGLITITHAALSSTLAAATTTTKYICVLDNTSFAYRIDSASTATGQYQIAVPNGFTAIAHDKIKYVASTVLFFSDAFARSDGAPGNNWTASGTVSINWQISTANFGAQKVGSYSGINGNGNAILYRNLEDYSSASFPLEMTFDVLNSVSAGNWASINNHELSVLFGSNTDADDGDGAGVFMNMVTGSVGIRIAGVTYGSTAFAFAPDNAAAPPTTVYSCRLRVTSAGVFFKIWAATGAEPSGWTTTYSVGLSYTNAYLKFYIRMVASVGTVSNVVVDNVVINSVGGVQIITSIINDISATAGQKFTLASGLKRNSGLANTPLLRGYALKVG